MVDAVEDVFGAAVPELTMVEHGIDHRRCVPRLHTPCLQLADVEAVRVFTLAEMMNSLRRDGVVAVGSRIERAAKARIRQAAEREVGLQQLRVGAFAV